ncbi:MAG: hypothetical protein RIS35_2913 [Pseudomonadota bacterium]
MSRLLISAVLLLCVALGAAHPAGARTPLGDATASAGSGSVTGTISGTVTGTVSGSVARSAADARYSLAEVARHASPGDCWMAIDGVVYDFTAYLPKHPADPAVITKHCGRDASEAFRTKGTGRPHSSYAQGLLRSYRKGALAR